MVDPKKVFINLISLTALLLGNILLPSVAFASPRSSFYDFGPYYSPQVLGFSFSSLENLPVPKIPDNLIPAKATGILPDSPLYFLDKLWENTQVVFTTDPLKKEELRLQIASERLSEGKTLMDQGKTDSAATALSDYNKAITAVSENVSAASASEVEKTVAAQAVLVQTLSLASPPAQAESWALAAAGADRALDKAAETKLSPPIPQDLSTKIQQFKTDGLISEEESNKIYSFKTRSEVRSELEKLTSSNQFPPSELSKLDTAVAEQYPEVFKSQTANLQVAELKSYQSLPQPPKEVLTELKKFQDNPSVPPSNTIKPYLWYNRAAKLAKEVDLSNFSPSQQSEVAKIYPQAITANPTYQPPPSPTPTPSASPSPAPTSTKDQTTSQSQATNQTTSPSPSSSPTPAPSSAPPAAQLYVGAEVGALPGSFNYNLKRWNEQLSLSFTFDPAEKARLKIQQAERRLAEAAALSSDPKKASLYANTLKDYRQTLNDAANYLKNAPESLSARSVAKSLEAQSARHEILLEKGLLPSKDPKLISEAIRTAENAMDKAADALGKPALPPALASRLGDLKAQGLILPEEADALVRSNSRSEAREKIRKLTEISAFPSADAKKLDEAQLSTSPSDYNQLTEVRKVEELQNLRSVQTDLAQTPTLKSTATTLAQKEAVLTSSIDTTLIKPADLAGRENLVKAYEKLSSIPRPINSGQFGAEATPGAQPKLTPPSAQDAVLSTCPEGAIFKQFQGCVWADSGKSLNDYDQYKCQGSRQYYSFAVKKCVVSDPAKGFGSDDAKPLCPVGYNWSWQTQSCQTSTGGILPFPTPSPEPEPKDDRERQERSRSCPELSSYKAPNGCVWDTTGKSVYESNQYRCSSAQYYSFQTQKCVPSPKPGQPYPQDTTPDCKTAGTYWSWSEGKCLEAKTPTPSQPLAPGARIIDEFRTPVIAPSSPFYFFKQATEVVQRTFAVTPEAKEQVSLAQAEERLAEAAEALKKNDESGFKKAVNGYTSTMQLLVADVSKSALTEGVKIKLGKQLGKQAAEQNLLLEKLSAWAPKEQETVLSAAVSATILGVDKAADISGQPPIPQEIKTKIETLPEKMISENDKKKLLQTDSRVEARLKLGGLVTNGGLTQKDTSFLNEDFDKVDQNAKIKVEELKQLETLAEAEKSKDDLKQKIEKNEQIVQKLQEFEKTFEVGSQIPSEIRPFVRLTRINEVTQTIRPDIVKLGDFQNRKDIILAVATLQEEFRPTKESFRQVEDFRRKNPSAPLPPELARIEALSFSLGVRQQAAPCFLPTPPFPTQTPCPAPGAAIPIASYSSSNSWYSVNYNTAVSTPAPSTDKDGKPLVYGQGPQAARPGQCSSGYHWMYDSGGWCMSDSGSYGSAYTYTPTGTGPGYTPYSPYYSAPGVPPGSFGFQGGGYSPPNYYGTAPNYYTTTPPAGTVPGSGPKPTSPGQCPSGYHWMSDSGGWCMADGPTYVPGSGSYSGGSGYYQTSYPAGTTTASTPPEGGYNCGSQPYDPITKRCKDGACPGGFNWDGSKCVASSYGGNSGGGSYYSPNLNQSSCGPGYYWNGQGCIRTSSTDTYGSCNPPGGGCGYNSYWDYGSCSCRGANSYSGGAGPSPSNYCQGISCGGGAYLDYSSCSCKYSSSGSTWSSGSGSGCSYAGSCQGGWWDNSSCSCKYSSSGGSSYGGSTSCSPPSGGCGSGYFDYGSCSCKQASSQGCYNVSASSCGSGFYWDASACTCRSSGTSSSTGTTSTSGGGSSSGSCPSGYHWMSDNGGWCMSDSTSTSSGSSGSTSTSTTSPTSSPAPTTSTSTTSTTSPTSSPAPTTSTSTTTTSTSTSTSTPAPAPTQTSAPAPSSSP